MWYLPDYSGEFVVINYETGEMQEIFLEPPSDIYFLRDNSLIARSESRLIHIPIIEGKIAVDDAGVLWAEREGEEKIIKYLDVVFPGPAEVPEETLLERAGLKNQIGESAYEFSGYQRGIEFFNLALEYNPEYAKAYSNLGRAFLNSRDMKKL